LYRRFSMTRIVFANRFPVILLVLFALLAGCATTVPKDFARKEANEPERLMKEGLQLFKDEYYEDASKTFQKIRDRYPYSKFVVDAELKIADCFYMQGHYDEAYTAYAEFERLHPKNKNIPYVIYQKGMCHYKQVDTIDRDQSHTYAAKEEFERLVKRFPGSKYAKQSVWKIRRCYVNLTQYELYVGNFYFRMKKYRAAMIRYRYVLEHYPDVGEYHDALESLARCEKMLGLYGGGDVSAGATGPGPEAELMARKDYPCWQCLRIKHGRPKALEEIMKKEQEHKKN